MNQEKFTGSEVPKFSKSLGASTKLWVREGWHEASFILKTHWY